MVVMHPSSREDPALTKTDTSMLSRPRGHQGAQCPVSPDSHTIVLVPLLLHRLVTLDGTIGLCIALLQYDVAMQ